MAALRNVKVPCRHCQGQGFKWRTDPESLREVRLQAGVSLREMARRLRITPPFLSDIERGRRNSHPYIEVAYRALGLENKTPEG